MAILRNSNDGFDLSELFLQNEINDIGTFRKVSMISPKSNFDTDLSLTKNDSILGFF